MQIGGSNMWKEQLLNTKNTIRTDIINVPEEDNCNRQLKAYADKLKNMKGQLKLEGKLLTLISSNANEHRYHRALPIGIGASALEILTFEYNPMPEDVACKALEMIKIGKISNEQYEGYTFYMWVYEWKGENGDLYKDFYFKVLGPKNHRYKFLDLQHYVRLDFNTFDNNYDDIDVDWRK